VQREGGELSPATRKLADLAERTLLAKVGGHAGRAAVS
jgi:hypothetical protein